MIKHVRLALLASVLATGTARAADSAPLTLGPIWSDHGVIQRDAPIAVSGSTAAGAEVKGMLGTDGVVAQADAEGRFVLTFPARAASTMPVDLGVDAGGQHLERHDLLVGDVWLCSGQSNMEFPVTRALNGAMVAQMSADPQLRLIEIPKAIAYTPQGDFAKPVAWAAAAPDNVPPFSAACYFMARGLRAALHVPIGAIHASWGGSQIRPWLDPQAGAALYGAAEMALLHRFESDRLGAVTAFAPTWERWYGEGTGDSQPWLHPDQLAWQPVPQIAGWLAWKGTPLATHATGTVWLRRQVTLTKAQAAAGATVMLGVLDDMDMSFVNGHPVGNTFGWDEERAYRLPPAILHAGVNEIMVAVTNSYADGGFASPASKLAFRLGTGETMPLADGWRYSISTIASYPPRAPWDANGGIGVMYNRMIAPLGTLALRGMAWYQGESDTDTPGYGDRLKAMIAGWRTRFGPHMAVEIVQLANYGAPATGPGMVSSWAAMRDVQRQVVAADPDARLVSAIDIGERTDIHPANKLLLGNRLALAAQGKAMPMPESATRGAGGVRIHFTGVEGGLQVWSAPGPIGFELCDAVGACRYASATAAGDDVMLADDGKPVATVRYAWADSPVVDLFDGRQIPVPAFALPVR